MMLERYYISEARIEKAIPEESYLNDIVAIAEMKKRPLDLRSSITFLIGENGTGKSTIIEALAIAAGFNPEGGTKNFSFATSNSHSDLYKYMTIVRNSYYHDGFFLRAESFYNLASDIDRMDKESPGNRRLIDSYGGISLHEQSHGESFLALVKNRFSGKGLYILDEPEAALSPSRLMQLLCLIKDLIDKDSQFIIATHSPILMSYPGAMIYELNENGIRRIEYADTEHYRITKDFIDKPEVMYSHLFQ